MLCACLPWQGITEESSCAWQVRWAQVTLDTGAIAIIRAMTSATILPLAPILKFPSAFLSGLPSDTRLLFRKDRTSPASGGEPGGWLASRGSREIGYGDARKFLTATDGRLREHLEHAILLHRTSCFVVVSKKVGHV